jgi:uncharacterized protein (TIGR02246 family)
MNMRTILTCAAILACAACEKESAPVKTADTSAETQAIETVEKGQIAAIGQKYLAGATDVYAADAVFIGDDGKSVQGKDAVQGMFKDFLADPALKIDYRPGPKILSSSGDMAYSTASYTETYTDPKTKKPVTVTGTNLSVWRKQADGSWKLAADSNPAGRTD